MSLLVTVVGAPTFTSAANPPGNNGTVKIDAEPFDTHPNNEPHVGCRFQVDWYGFDQGQLFSNVIFEVHPPTGRSVVLLTDRVFIGEDDNSGGGSQRGLDAQRTYNLSQALASFKAHPNQGYHVKLTLHSDGSQGADVKHKVYWVQRCAPPQTPTPTPTKTPTKTPTRTPTSTPTRTSCSCPTPTPTKTPTPTPTRTPTPTPTRTPTPTPTKTPCSCPTPTPPPCTCTSNTLVNDSFDRSSTGGWGALASSGSYSVGGNAAAYSVSGSKGVITHSSAATSRSALLNSVSGRDVDIRFRVSSNRVASGAPMYVSAVARRNGSNEYRPRLILNANGTVSVHASILQNGAESSLGAATVVPGLTQSANSFIWFRAQVVGANPTTIRIKAWAAGTSEPATWQWVKTVNNAVCQSSGTVGLRTYVGSSATNIPVVWRFDDYRVLAL